MVSNEKWFGASAGFYPETIGQSLRFDRASSSYLRRTGISSAGNRDKITISAWLKLSNTVYGNVYNIYSQGTSLNNSSVFYIWRHKLRYAQVVSGSDYIVVATADLRDYTNFLHVALTVDMTESSNSDKVHFYINGKREAISSGSYLSTNTDMYFNGTDDASIGASASGVNYYDGYMAELNVLDGTIVGATQDSDGNYILDEFGETKNGVWIPKAYSGSYGTNGFRMTFGNSSNIGEDSAGSNDFGTVNNINDYDIVPDSPTNNFCTWNANDDFGAGTLSEGNTKWVATSGSNEAVASTFAMPTSGKWYWEYHAQDKGYLSHIGLTSAGTDYNNTGSSDGTRASWGFGTWNATYNSNVTKYTSSGGGSAGTNWSSAGNVTDGQVLACAYDADNGTLWFSKEGTFINSSGTANPATNTDPRFSGLNDGTQWFAYNTQYPDGSPDFFVNFGQDSSFAGSKTSGSSNAQDDNGIGDFYYSPPSGFLALCSSNLPDTTISPAQDTQADDHFSILLYDGDGNSTQDVTGVGFQPDWTWIKERTSTSAPVFLDSSRGYDKFLVPSSTNDEGTGVSNSVLPDGFQTNNSGVTNENNQNYVAWNWLAGGTTPTKTYKVVVVSDSGNKYRFRNSADSATFAQSAVALDLQEGGTYVFDWSDSTAQGHPIRFSTTSDGTHGSGSEYTTGVVKDDSAYKTTITVASSAPTLYYYCQNHSGMGGQVNTNTTHGSTNFDGSILSVSQTNETSGFSILTYTGNGSGGATIGHNLSSAPKWVIVKRRDASDDWSNFHTSLGGTKYIDLNSSNAVGTSSVVWNDTDPTSSVVTLGTSNRVNGNSATYVAYVFAEIEGYSKFGSYTGNGSTDGTYIHLGFRASWIMTKRTNGAGLWLIFDNKRNGFNPDNRELKADSISAEADADRIDFLSNGFKQRLAGIHNNGSSDTYIYMAFAEQPFKFSNAR